MDLIVDVLNLVEYLLLLVGPAKLLVQLRDMTVVPQVYLLIAESQ